MPARSPCPTCCAWRATAWSRPCIPGSYPRGRSGLTSGVAKVACPARTAESGSRSRSAGVPSSDRRGRAASRGQRRRPARGRRPDLAGGRSAGGSFRLDSASSWGAPGALSPPPAARPPPSPPPPPFVLGRLASPRPRPPLAPATEGPSGLGIGSLLATTGQVTFDPGFVNTASCRSAITFIDGDAGILRYRGYPIEQLAENSTFLETSYLLIYGELPDRGAARRVRRQRPAAHAAARGPARFFDGFPRDAHPMAVLSSAVSALSTFYQDSLDPFDPEQVEISTVRLLAKLPTIAAYAYKKSIGQPFLYPDNSLGYVENFLRMTFGVPAEPYEVDPAIAQGARHAVHPARRPRAELLDVDRAHGRLEPRQPVRLGLGRRQRAVRAAARRRQPGRARDARRASPPTAATSRRSSSGSRTRSRASS